MKIILYKDVPNLGEEGDVKIVANHSPVTGLDIGGLTSGNDHLGIASLHLVGL